MDYNFSEVELLYIYDSICSSFSLVCQEIDDIERYLKKEHLQKFKKVVESEERKLKVLKIDLEVLNKLINKFEGTE